MPTIYCIRKLCEVEDEFQCSLQQQKRGSFRDYLILLLSTNKELSLEVFDALLNNTNEGFKNEFKNKIKEKGWTKKLNIKDILFFQGKLF